MIKVHGISSSKIKNITKHRNRFVQKSMIRVLKSRTVHICVPRKNSGCESLENFLRFQPYDTCSRDVAAKEILDWRSKKKKKEKNVRRAVHIDRSKTIFCSRQSRFLRTRETYLRFLYCTRHSRIASCTYLICNATTKVPLYHMDSQFQSASDHVTGQLLGTCRSYMSNIHYISVNYSIL